METLQHYNVVTPVEFPSTPRLCALTDTHMLLAVLGDANWNSTGSPGLEFQLIKRTESAISVVDTHTMLTNEFVSDGESDDEQNQTDFIRIDDTTAVLNFHRHSTGESHFVIVSRSGDSLTVGSPILSAGGQWATHIAGEPGYFLESYIEGTGDPRVGTHALWKISGVNATIVHSINHTSTYPVSAFTVVRRAGKDLDSDNYLVTMVQPNFAGSTTLIARYIRVRRTGDSIEQVYEVTRFNQGDDSSGGSGFDFRHEGGWIGSQQNPENSHIINTYKWPNRSGSAGDYCSIQLAGFVVDATSTSGDVIQFQGFESFRVLLANTWIYSSVLGVPGQASSMVIAAYHDGANFDTHYRIAKSFAPGERGIYETHIGPPSSVVNTVSNTSTALGALDTFTDSLVVFATVDEWPYALHLYFVDVTEDIPDPSMLVIEPVVQSHASIMPLPHPWDEELHDGHVSSTWLNWVSGGAYAVVGKLAWDVGEAPTYDLNAPPYVFGFWLYDMSDPENPILQDDDWLYAELWGDAHLYPTYVDRTVNAYRQRMDDWGDDALMVAFEEDTSNGDMYIVARLIREVNGQLDISKTVERRIGTNLDWSQYIIFATDTNSGRACIMWDFFHNDTGHEVWMGWEIAKDSSGNLSELNFNPNLNSAMGSTVSNWWEHDDGGVTWQRYRAGGMVPVDPSNHQWCLAFGMQTLGTTPRRFRIEFTFFDLANGTGSIHAHSRWSEDLDTFVLPAWDESDSSFSAQMMEVLPDGNIGLIYGSDPRAGEDYGMGYEVLDMSFSGIITVHERVHLKLDGTFQWYFNGLHRLADGKFVFGINGRYGIYDADGTLLTEPPGFWGEGGYAGNLGNEHFSEGILPDSQFPNNVAERGNYFNTLAWNQGVDNHFIAVVDHNDASGVDRAWFAVYQYNPDATFFPILDLANHNNRNMIGGSKGSDGKVYVHLFGRRPI